jgi:hypothetical protein
LAGSIGAVVVGPPVRKEEGWRRSRPRAGASFFFDRPFPRSRPTGRGTRGRDLSSALALGREWIDHTFFFTYHHCTGGVLNCDAVELPSLGVWETFVSTVRVSLAMRAASWARPHGSRLQLHELSLNLVG